MNQVQKEIAEAICRHLIRQNACMHRDGPVDRINEDQDELLADLIVIFERQNPSFHKEAFLEIALP